MHTLQTIILTMGTKQLQMIVQNESVNLAEVINAQHHEFILWSCQEEQSHSPCFLLS